MKKPALGSHVFANGLSAAAAAAILMAIGLPVPAQHKEIPIGHGPAYATAFSTDGKMFALNTRENPSTGKSIVVFDVTKDKLAAVIKDGLLGAVVEGLTFAKDDRVLLSATTTDIDGKRLGSQVKFWRIQGPELIKVINAEGRPLALSGEVLITTAGSDRKKAWVHDLDTGQRIAILDGHGSIIEKMAISPERKWAASLEQDGPVKVWELPSGKCLHTFKYRGNVRRIMFTAKGPQLAVSTTGLALYDLNTGKVVAGTGFFPAQAVSADGKLAARRGQLTYINGKIRKHYPDALHVLSVDKKAVIASFDVPPRVQLERMWFSPDGRRLLSAEQGILRVWDLSKLES